VVVKNLDDFACIIYDSSFHSTIHFLVLPKLFSEFLVHVFTKLLLFCSNCSLNFLALLNWCCLLELSQVVLYGLPDCAVEDGAPRRNGRAAGPDACASPAVAWVADDGDFFRCASRRAARGGGVEPPSSRAGWGTIDGHFGISTFPSSLFSLSRGGAGGRQSSDRCVWCTAEAAIAPIDGGLSSHKRSIFQQEPTHLLITFRVYVVIWCSTGKHKRCCTRPGL
jgi:hypothetical protein